MVALPPTYQNQIGHLNWLRPMQVGWQTGAVNLAPQTDQGGQACRSTWLINNDQPRRSGSLVDVDQPINADPTKLTPTKVISEQRPEHCRCNLFHVLEKLDICQNRTRDQRSWQNQNQGWRSFWRNIFTTAIIILMVALTFLSIKNIVMHQYLGFQM